MPNAKSKNSSSTLIRGLMALEMVAREGSRKGVTIQEVVSALGVHQSNIYRYLTTLCESGWLERDDTYRYHLGRKSLQLSGASLNQLDLRAIAHVHLQKLADETQLTIHLSIMCEDQILYIDKVESESLVQMRSLPGMVAPMYCTAMGKAILATMPNSLVRNLMDGKLKPRTPNTLVTMDALMENLEKIRKCGFSVDNKEFEEGIGCIGAAIYGYDDQILGAISVSSLFQLLSSGKISFLGEKVRVTASQISQSMGCLHEHWNLNT
jgi:IclR family KDG regulon transcriptional repressor